MVNTMSTSSLGSKLGLAKFAPKKSREEVKRESEQLQQEQAQQADRALEKASQLEAERKTLIGSLKNEHETAQQALRSAQQDLKSQYESIAAAAEADAARAEGGIFAELHARSGCASGARSAMAFGEGDAVQAQFKGKGKLHPGKVMKVNGDGTYSVLFDCGDKDDAVTESGIQSRAMSIREVQELVGARHLRVKGRFPSATHAELCGALLTYSPESALFAKGRVSSEPIVDGQWEKFQGELQYGSFSSFHNGVDEVIGKEVPDKQALAALVDEIMRSPKPEEDRYNLWYVAHCAAVEQTNYNEKGEPRVVKGTNTHKPKLDAGHGGMRLQDFVDAANAMLKTHDSKKRLATVQVLALRLYTGSTFRRLQDALRDKGMGRIQGKLPFQACVQSARKGVLIFQAIPRSAVCTFRGVTGYLAAKFKAEKMGMDYSFFSTSVDNSVGADFAGGVALSVIFEVDYVAGYPGADISILSLFPGEKEVLYAPCTCLNLKDTDTAGRDGAGQDRVAVSPSGYAM